MIRHMMLRHCAAALVALSLLAACSSSATPAAPTIAPAAATSVPAAAPAASVEAPLAVPAMTRLNLNEATPEQFLTIPDVGQRMVREFNEYRPYRSIQQFRREIGKYVSDEQVAAYEQYVYVPVDRNQADGETLKQLPGVDDAVAAELIAGRPYAANADFLTALAGKLTAADAQAAAGYLVTP
jgi:DNA uptake protein ComE-like DNA-binding protein